MACLSACCSLQNDIEKRLYTFFTRQRNNILGARSSAFYEIFITNHYVTLINPALLGVLLKKYYVLKKWR